jgi:hypothetical protein
MSWRIESFNGCGCPPCGQDPAKTRWRLVSAEGQWTRETYASETEALKALAATQKVQKPRKIVTPA